MRRTTGRPWWAVLLVLGVAACGDSTGPQEPEEVAFAAALNVDLAQMTKLPSGVYIRTLTPGTGTAAITATSNWAMNYKFWLSNGTLVDQNALTRAQCSPSCIEGFEIGIIGLKVGEVRQIVIPSRLGYGSEDHPSGRIPGNSVLVYEVTGITIS
jgi:FKBP-type peptidyl-prolyl cis-trans isomerase